MLEQGFIPLLRLVFLLAREGIRFALLGPRPISNGEVEVREEQRPLSLMLIENPGRGEILQIPMITEDCYLMLSTMKIMMPSLKCSDNSQKLLIIDIIVNLSRGELVRVKGHRVEELVILILRQNSSKGKIGCISFNDEWA